MSNKTTIATLITIILIGLILRMVNIDLAPAGIYPDEAQNGFDAYLAWQSGNWQWFYPDNNGREGLYINMIAASFALFGVSILALKLPSIIAGTLTIWGIYLLSRELFWRSKFSAQIALASAFFLSVSFWHINFSRIGFRAILLPLVLVFSFWLLLYGLRKLHEFTNSQKPHSQTNLHIIAFISFFIGGLIFGLGLHTYIAFRIAPVVLIVFLMILLISHQFKLRKLLAPISLFIIGALISAAPILVTFAQNPEYLSGRSSVSVFDPTNNGGDLGGKLVETIGLSLGMFNFYGDQNWRHGEPSSATLQLLVGILFLIGLFTSAICAIRIPISYILRKIQNKPTQITSKCQAPQSTYWLLLAWFGALLAPAFLTTEGLPHSLRAIGTIGAVYIFAGFGFGIILSYLSNKLTQLGKYTQNPKIMQTVRKIGKMILIGIMIFIGVSGAMRYHNTWANSPQMANAFNNNLLSIAQHINTVNKSEIAQKTKPTDKIVIAGPLERLPIQLLTTQTPNITYIYEHELPQIAQIITDHQLTNPVIYTTTDAPHIIQPLTRQLDDLEITKHNTRLQTTFYIITIKQ